jgi:hypothetical protein
MRDAHHSTVIGVFDTREQGYRAVEELRRAGFADSHITMIYTLSTNR